MTRLLHTAIILLIASTVSPFIYICLFATFNTDTFHQRRVFEDLSDMSWSSQPNQPTAGNTKAYQHNVSKWLGTDTKPPFTIFSEFLINPTGLCEDVTHLDYLIVVHSSFKHIARRQAIRDTFGRRGLFGHLSQRVVFLIGMSLKTRHSFRVKRESDTFQDIVQGPFLDTYENLTLKAVMGLKWISLYCPNSTYIIKIDDDVFVNIFLVIHTFLPQFQGQSHHIGCRYYKEDENLIKRPSDSSWSKWEVEESQFDGLSGFPFGNCKGVFVIMSGDLIEPLLRAAEMTPFFWIDDLYLFGLLPLAVGDVTFTDLSPFFQHWYKHLKTCIRSDGTKCQNVVLVSNGMDDRFVLFSWQLMMSTISNDTKTEFNMSEESFTKIVNIDDPYEVSQKK